MGDSAEALSAAGRQVPSGAHRALAPRPVPREEDIRGYLLAQDIVWVAGGNTANMLAIWRVHGVDVALREAWERASSSPAGAPGRSAGSSAAPPTPSISTAWRRSTTVWASSRKPLPLYDGEAQRRAALAHQLVRDGFPAGYAADDDAAMHWIVEDLAEVVTARGGAGVYRVERVGGQVVETPLTPRRVARHRG